MNRRMWIGVAVVALATLVATVAAAAAGWAWPTVAAVAACSGAGCAGAMVGGGETIRWPAIRRRERTSAGWHEARILAETLAAAAPDPASRRHLTARIDAALGRPGRPVGAPPGATRREYEQVLAELRRRSR